MSGPKWSADTAPSPTSLAAHLEPVAVVALDPRGDGEIDVQATALMAAMSAAVSLKRIADHLDALVAPASGLGLLDVLSENHLWNLGRAFGNGQRT